MGNRWLKFNPAKFNDVIFEYRAWTEGCPKHVYDKFCELGEEVIKAYEAEIKPNVKPYELARAMITTFKSKSSWPLHWHDSVRGGWEENLYLEQYNVEDSTPLDAFFGSGISPTVWFAGTMYSCLYELEGKNDRFHAT